MNSPSHRPQNHNPLLRLLVVNWLVGAFIALMLTGLVLFFDIAHLRSLIMNSSDPVVPAIMLVFGFIVTMCSVAMGTAIMGLAERDDDKDGGRRFRLFPPARHGDRMAMAAQPVRPNHPRHPR